MESAVFEVMGLLRAEGIHIDGWKVLAHPTASSCSYGHPDGWPRAVEREPSIRWSEQESPLSCLSPMKKPSFCAPRTLHGDPHNGNVVLTRSAPRWLEFESVCSGPLEWDLSALPVVRTSSFTIQTYFVCSSACVERAQHAHGGILLSWRPSDITSRN